MTRDRRRTTEDREPGAEDGEPRMEDGNRQPAREEAQPNNRTCYYCAYAHWMRMGPSVLMAMDWRRHLICLNHPDAPGEFREVLGNGACPNFLARREPAVRVEPPEPPNDKIKYIALTQGKHAIVDAADFEWLNQHKWHAARGSGGGCYAARWENGRLIFMHRQIMNAPDDAIVDHINRCPADNRRCNLRLCTLQQNVFNRYTGAHSSRYQGVSYFKRSGKWAAHIKIDQRHERLGYFDDEVEAAQVRDRWAFAFHGRFAYLNFPADFEGKDPNDAEFHALRDQLQEKRRKREEKKTKGKGKKGKAKQKRGKPEDGGQTTEDGPTTGN